MGVSRQNFEDVIDGLDEAERKRLLEEADRFLDEGFEPPKGKGPLVRSAVDTLERNRPFVGGYDRRDEE